MIFCSLTLEHEQPSHTRRFANTQRTSGKCFRNIPSMRDDVTLCQRKEELCSSKFHQTPRKFKNKQRRMLNKMLSCTRKNARESLFRPPLFSRRNKKNPHQSFLTLSFLMHTRPAEFVLAAPAVDAVPTRPAVPAAVPLALVTMVCKVVGR